MPRYCVPGTNLDLPRNLALLDTNVLVAFADGEDEHHADVCAVLEMEDYIWLVVPSVVVETWGLLVGKRRKWDAALYLVSWLLTPGNVILIPEPEVYLQDNMDIASRHRMDLVDAKLLCVANSITKECGMKPAVYIVTYDIRDFYKCVNSGYLFNIYNMNSMERIAFDN